MNAARIVTAGLAAAAMTAALVSTAGAATASTTAHRFPPCQMQLSVISEVAHQSGVQVGSEYMPAYTSTGPRTWARELRSADLGPLAQTALAVPVHGTDERAERDYVMALQATAVAILQGNGNCVR
jgi:hypothetical protein